MSFKSLVSSLHSPQTPHGGVREVSESSECSENPLIFAVHRHGGRWLVYAPCVRELSGRVGVWCVGVIAIP
jgi:hypothetical protein